MFVIPINRDARPEQTPWVTFALIVLCSLLWVVPSLFGQNNQIISQFGYRLGAFSALLCAPGFPALFRTTPELEKEEMFADREEKTSGLTTLGLNG